MVPDNGSGVRNRREIMENSNAEYTTIDEYIRQFEPEVREKLERLRAVIKEAAPDAVEKISYQMPTFYLYGNLVHFAAFKTHIGFYPAPSGIEAFNEEIAKYKWAKGSVQFPMEQPIPYELIGRVVRFRVAENIRIHEEKTRVPGTVNKM